MPDHVHGIIVLVGATPRGCPTPRGCQTSDAPPYACPIAVGRAQGPAYPIGRAQGPAPTEPTRPARTERLSLPDVVHRFKSLTTARYRDGVKQHGWPAFDGHLWQRNYHEHIIRDDAELLRIQRYIVHNPAHEHRGMVSMDEGRSL